MGIPLRVLIIEDSENDAILLLRELKRGGYDPTFERVDTSVAMTEVLDRKTWDIVIADYSMPHFSAPEALKLLQKSGLDIPFIIVSGKIGEETAVAAMKAGAHDYIMKDNMVRLIPAIERELQEAKIRQEHKQVEEALKEIEAKNRTLLDAIPDMMFRICKDGTFLDFKGKDSDLLVPPSEFLGKKMYEILPKKLAEQVEYYMERSLQTGDIQIFEYQIEGGNDYEARLIVNGEDEFLAIVRNITERKQAVELRLENEQLAHMNQAKSEFLAIVSHELRTPLTSIIGYSILLKENKHGNLNKKQEFYVDNTLKSSHHLLDLISDLLEMTTIETGKIELIIEQIPVHATIDETLEYVKQIAVKKNVVIERKIDPQLDFIEADRKRFKQILLNLIDNAIKFSQKDGGKVTITAKKEGDTAQFSISDIGIGIKEKDISKIFDMFHQVDTGMSRLYSGSGLGLSISKNIVEMHGGTISVESNYGEGSTFTFFLPLRQKIVKVVEDCLI